MITEFFIIARASIEGKETDKYFVTFDNVKQSNKEVYGIEKWSDNISLAYRFGCDNYVNCLGYFKVLEKKKCDYHYSILLCRKNTSSSNQDIVPIKCFYTTEQE